MRNAACGPANHGIAAAAGEGKPAGADDLSGTVSGAGASSQENAELGWAAGFNDPAPAPS